MLLGIVNAFLSGVAHHLYINLFLIFCFLIWTFLCPILFSPLNRYCLNLLLFTISIRKLGDVEKTVEGGRFRNHVGPGKRRFGKGIPPVVFSLLSHFCSPMAGLN